MNRTLNSSNSLGICSPKALHDDSHFHLSNSQTCLYSYEKLVFERNLKDSKGLNDDSPYGKILRSFSLREKKNSSQTTTAALLTQIKLFSTQSDYSHFRSFPSRGVPVYIAT